MTTDEKLDLILAELIGVKDDVQGLKSDVQGLKDDVQGLKDDVQKLKSDVDELKGDVQELKTRVTKIELMMESEVSRNIKVIAEGHLTFTKQLQDLTQVIIEVQAKQELHDIYLNSHESRLRSIV